MYLAETVNPSTKFATDSWMQFAADFTGDGWPDVITVSYGAENGGVFLYVNPKGEDRRCDKYKVAADVQSELRCCRMWMARVSPRWSTWVTDKSVMQSPTLPIPPDSGPCTTFPKKGMLPITHRGWRYQWR
jgi:hypothetical protein